MGNSSSKRRKEGSSKNNPAKSEAFCEPVKPPVSHVINQNTTNRATDRNLMSQLECCICMEPALPFVNLSPCGHFLCGACAGNVTMCPQCRTLIQGKIHAPQLTDTVTELLKAAGKPIPKYQPFHSIVQPVAHPNPEVPSSASGIHRTAWQRDVLRDPRAQILGGMVLCGVGSWMAIAFLNYAIDLLATFTITVLVYTTKGFGPIGSVIGLIVAASSFNSKVVRGRQPAAGALTLATLLLIAKVIHFHATAA